MHMNLRDCRIALAMTLVTLTAGGCAASDNASPSDPPEGLPITKVLEYWTTMKWDKAIEKDFIDHFYTVNAEVVDVGALSLPKTIQEGPSPTHGVEGRQERQCTADAGTHGARYRDQETGWERHVFAGAQVCARRTGVD